ncbi:hypothetical protein [Catellatospora sp. TT07R-123]|uniref:hypothetical protein n=1 Tax=Catellatospora sp. TT07R-123 TaxID=2733863 RepID=UPI001BB412B7|nr:hypothetical protein [Catellatospora sp. TT07R-123]
MVVIQRIRVVWGPQERGAAHADLRRAVPGVLRLPESLPDDAVVVHDVVARSGTGYRLDEHVLSGARAADAVSLELGTADGGVAVRTGRLTAVYPWQQYQRRLFTVAAGETALYRANFRFRGCMCAANSWYEDWTVRVANAPAHSDLFIERSPRHLADHRVHLYGGRGHARSAAKRSAA